MQIIIGWHSLSQCIGIQNSVILRVPLLTRPNIISVIILTENEAKQLYLPLQSWDGFFISCIHNHIIIMKQCWWYLDWHRYNLLYNMRSYLYRCGHSFVFSGLSIIFLSAGTSSIFLHHIVKENTHTNYTWFLHVWFTWHNNLWYELSFDYKPQLKMGVLETQSLFIFWLECHEAGSCSACLTKPPPTSSNSSKHTKSNNMKTTQCI